jgi:hypothetical protein
VNRLIQTLLLVFAGLAVLAAAGPELGRLAGALVPLVTVLFVGAAVLRIVWFYTR